MGDDDTTEGTVQAPDTLAPSPGGDVTSGGDEQPVPEGDGKGKK